jgi:hypothetical protein
LPARHGLSHRRRGLGRSQIDDSENVMQNKPDFNEQQLRLATSLAAARTLARGRHRDGFLALGGALDAAAGQFDEAALIARLQLACLTKDDVTAVLPSHRIASTWQMSSASRSPRLHVAISASSRSGCDITCGKTLVVKQEPSRSPAMAPGPVIAEATSPARGLWFDPLDDEIALAQAEFQRLAGGQRGVDGSLSQMNDRLEALSDELFRGSL